MHTFWNDAIFRRPCIPIEKWEIHFENFGDPLKLDYIKEGLDVLQQQSAVIDLYKKNCSLNRKLIKYRM